MGSCSTSGACPSKYAPYLVRLGYGIALAGFGVNHLRHAEGFTESAGAVFMNTPVASLAMTATVLAYVVAVLQIVGGALFATRLFCPVAKICIMTVFGGILGWAGLAVMFGGAEAGMQVGPAIQGATIWLLGYAGIKKMECCSMGAGACPTTGSCK